jgi:hypothetical protein
MGSWDSTVPTFAVGSVRAADLQTMADIASALTGAWTAYSPAWGATSAPSIGSGTFDGSYARVGKTGMVQMRLVGAADTGWGTGSYSFSLPASWSLAVGVHVNLYGYAVVVDSSAAVYYQCTVGVVAGDLNKVRVRPTGMGNLNATNLVTLATTDEIVIRVFTEWA